MTYFDSHLHLNHLDFQEREKLIWKEANDAGVKEGVVIGYDIPSSLRAVELAESLPGLYASVGVSPHDIMEAPSNAVEQLRSMAVHPKVVAIGECGLEYHYPAGPKDKQIEGFIKQSQLARDLGKVLVIHLREADDDFLNILSNDPPDSAILHCFTATERIMQASVEKGYFISFSGILTFKSARELHTIAPQVPAENILVETDSPFLAPTPHRGKQCEPKMVVETVKKLAELREQDVNEIARQTRENAHRAFGIDN